MAFRSLVAKGKIILPVLFAAFFVEEEEEEVEVDFRPEELFAVFLVPADLAFDLLSCFLGPFFPVPIFKQRKNSQLKEETDYSVQNKYKKCNIDVIS